MKTGAGSAKAVAFLEFSRVKSPFHSHASSSSSWLFILDIRKDFQVSSNAIQSWISNDTLCKLNNQLASIVIEPVIVKSSWLGCGRGLEVGTVGS